MELILNRHLAAVYVLNLDRRKDRLQLFTQRAEEAGLTGHLSPRRIPGVDGRAIAGGQLNSRASLPESATTMGHRFLWGLALGHGRPVLILEDDVIFCRGFINHLGRPLELPDSIDVLQLGMSWLQVKEGFGSIRTPKLGYGLFAYVLFPSGARKLLQREADSPLGIADHYSVPQESWTLQIVYPTWVRCEGQDSDIAQREDALKRFGNHFDDND